MSRPIQTFLSHQHRSREAVSRLESAMRRRGLASWRDRKNLDPGDETDAMIEHAIASETSGFVLYGDENVAESDYVWCKEWSRAIRRRRRERELGIVSPYRVSPLFVTPVTPSRLRDIARSHELNPDEIGNGEFMNSDDDAEDDRVARLLLAAALKDRVRAEGNRPLRISLTTFQAPTGHNADVLVDWRPELDSPVIDWAPLLRARNDLRDVLLELGSPIHLECQARLPAAFFLGHAFPPVARIPFTVIHRDGQRWSSSPSPDMDAVAVALQVLDGDPAVAVVEVSLARDVRDRADAVLSAAGITPGHRLAIGFRSRSGDVDQRVAEAASAAFGRQLRRLGDEGVRVAHVFLAAPAALAALMGSSINAGPTLVVHSGHGTDAGSLTLP